MNKQEGIAVEGSCEPGGITIDVALLTIDCVMVHTSLSGKLTVKLVFTELKIICFFITSTNTGAITFNCMEKVVKWSC